MRLCRRFPWPWALLLVGMAVAELCVPGFAQGADLEGAGEAPVLVGLATRESIESFVPDWVEEEVAAQPDRDGVANLAAVEPGAEVEVFLGTWCSDSRRELGRLWKVFDLMSESGGEPPFVLRYVAVDRAKKEPAGEVVRAEILYLPTFVVRRAGREVGRIVESAPHGVENDLCALLAGRASGLLTTRTDLAPGIENQPPR